MHRSRSSPLDQSAEDEVGSGFLDAGHVLLFPASCLSDGAADSQLGPKLKTGLQFIVLDYGYSARPSQPAVYQSSCALSVLFIGPYLLKEHLGGKSIRRKLDYA
jgi:hypothetical protein